MFIVIEGVDGSGKGTQTKRLAAYLSSTGKDVAQFSFPRYEHTVHGKLVGEYLNGVYGDIPIKIASTLFAVDRFETREELEANISTRDYVLCDRWCPSNVAYSCAKVSREESQDLAIHLDKVDYDVFKQPVPDLLIHLDISIKNDVFRRFNVKSSFSSTIFFWGGGRNFWQLIFLRSIDKNQNFLSKKFL